MIQRVIIWCDGCDEEYRIEPTHEIEDMEENLTPMVCPFCKTKIGEYFFDEIDDENEFS